MSQGSSRQQQLAGKKARKEGAMKHPSGQSKYGRKAAYLKANGGFGWDYNFPKPWNS